MKKIVALVLSLVMVLGLATTAFAADTKLYAAGTGTGYVDGWSETALATISGVPADFVVDADYDFGDGNVEYYDLYSAGTFVEATKETGTHKLVCGNIVVYLTELTDVADVEYVYQADVFTGLTTEDDECGKLEVTKKNLDKTYYVVENDKGIPVKYYVKSTAGTNLLVDEKIVKATEVTSDFVTHVWVGNDVDATTKAYTSVVCANCGRVAKLYANADAAGKYAVNVGLGWITAADAGYAPVVVAPETDKVESAETFDAGIAMYVGMSVMAAAGSAVVLKKKD